MISTVRFWEGDKSVRMFFWGCLHYGHNKDFILNPRGFKDVTEAQEETVKRWNSKVSNKDIGFLLGDTVVGVGDQGGKVLLELLRRLNFAEMWLMPGNHYSGYSWLFKDLLKISEIDENYCLTCFPFENTTKVIRLIPNYYEINVNGQMIVLSHYPILSFNGASKNSVHLFSHVHNNLSKIPWLRDNYLNRRVLDVGLESCPYPMSFSEIMTLLRDRPKAEIDHH